MTVTASLNDLVIMVSFFSFTNSISLVKSRIKYEY